MDSPVNMSTRSKCSFSIEHILTVAGSTCRTTHSEPIEHYEWLRCTRYHPPKLHRQKKKEGVQRRNPGRNPRIPFSSSQVALLEAKFLETPYLSSADVIQLASCLKLSEMRVKIWFQNRRARERRERENPTNNQTQKDDNLSLNGQNDRVPTPKHDREDQPNTEIPENLSQEIITFQNRCIWPDFLFPITSREHWKSVANILHVYPTDDQH